MSLVLVVDDEADVRLVVRKILEHSGHQVKECASGAEALAALRSTKPDIVLTDLNMPGVDGMELLRSLRKSAPGAKIIVLSGAGDGPLFEIAKRLGAQATLDKPVRAADLLDAIKAVEK